MSGQLDIKGREFSKATQHNTTQQTYAHECARRGGKNIGNLD